jgi:hypothetical protein
MLKINNYMFNNQDPQQTELANKEYKSLSDTIKVTERSRVSIINNINNELEPYDFTKLSSDVEYTYPDKAPFKDVIRNYTNTIDINTGLQDIPEKISEIIPWQPVMHIYRSARGDGTINVHRGTATTITMYNNELSSNFFTQDDVSKCFWGANIDALTPANQSVYHIIPYTPIFDRYSKTGSKPGTLLSAPGTSTNGTGLIYYQFTMPYDCYICITLCVNINWNAIDSSNCGEIGIFGIADENDNILVARTPYDDGNGNNNSEKNRRFGTIYWHGYVKKGWKLYYVETDRYYVSANEWGQGGHSCLVFKVGQNSGKIIDDALINSVYPVLALHRSANSKYHTSFANNTAINLTMLNGQLNTQYIDKSKSWFGSNNNTTFYDEAQKAPENNKVIEKYSQTGSKGLTLFQKPNVAGFGCLHSTINVQKDGIVSLCYGGGNYSNYEDYSNISNGEPFGFVICDKRGLVRDARTSADDGNGSTINGTKVFSSVQYTGRVYAGDKIYFAHSDIAGNSYQLIHHSVGMSLVLYEFDNTDDLINKTKIISYPESESGTVTSINDGKNKEGYSVYNALHSIYPNDSFAYDGKPYLKYVEDSLDDVDFYYVSVTMGLSVDNCYCVIFRNDKTVNVTKYNTGDGTRNKPRVITKIFELRKNESIYVITCDTSFSRYISLAACPKGKKIVIK